MNNVERSSPEGKQLPGNLSVRTKAGYSAGLFLTLILIVWLFPASTALPAEKIPIIDAHSQIDQNITFEEILTLMDREGVSRTILAPRDQVKPDQVLSFASSHPDRITPAVRSKSHQQSDGSPEEFAQYLDNQLRNPGFGAMAEFLFWHAEKLDKNGKRMAPQVVVPPDDPKTRVAVERAIQKGWPFVAHVEFAAIGPDKDRFLSKFESLLKEYPDHPFVLNRLGELQAPEIKRLIANHGNVFFITAQCNPIAVKNTREPLVNIFKGNKLAPEWKELIVTHPDRFVLGFDNVWARHWKNMYVQQVELWRKALADIPEDVAKKVAFENAQGLWKLQIQH